MVLSFHTSSRILGGLKKKTNHYLGVASQTSAVTLEAGRVLSPPSSAAAFLLPSVVLSSCLLTTALESYS